MTDELMGRLDKEIVASEAEILASVNIGQYSVIESRRLTLLKDLRDQAYRLQKVHDALHQAYEGVLEQSEKMREALEEANYYVALAGANDTADKIKTLLEGKA